MRTFQLQPTNGRKSFYNKCHVYEYTVDGEKHSDLVSYDTRVAYYNHTENYVSVLGYFSKTTATHINAFLAFYGFEPLTKKQMEAKPQIEGAEA